MTWVFIMIVFSYANAVFTFRGSVVHTIRFAAVEIAPGWGLIKFPLAHYNLSSYAAALFEPAPLRLVFIC